jgi:hypothetical protein
MILILSSALVAIPAVPSGHSTALPFQSNNLVTSARDPNGALTAFNYSYSQANLYTNASARPPQEFPSSNFTGTSLTWLSTVNKTLNNSPIQNTGFRFSLTKENLTQGRVVANWTLTVPQFNCSGCTGVSVDFNFFGNLTKGTNATYAIYPRSPPNSTVIGSHSYTTLGAFPTGITLGCPESVCVDVTKYRGYNVTLSFSFGWTFSNQSRGMFAEAGEIVVASIGNFTPSTSNVMQQDPSNSNSIIHTTSLSGIKYNNTLTTYVQPGNVSTPRLWWHIEAISLYYAVGYTIKQVSLNGTKIFPGLTEVPFETEHCVPGTGCSQSVIAFNVTDFSRTLTNSNVTIISNTPNTVQQVTPVEQGVPVSLFTPGDQIGVKTVNVPAVVNASTSLKTGNYSVTFVNPAGTRQPLTGIANPATTVTGGVFNFTLPSGYCGSIANLCGAWIVFVVFTSGFDLGNMSSTFRIDQIQVSSFSSTGSNTGLTVTGALAYANKSAAATRGVVFAVDQNTPTNLPATTQGAPSTSLLYIANVSLVNGVFAQGQSLMMTFTLVNPLSSSQTLNANVTVEHEWPGSQTHGVNVTFLVGLKDGLGDLPFNITQSQSYQTTFTLTANGTMVKLTSLSNGNSRTTWMSRGTSPVVSTRAHAGLFKVTVVSKSGASTPVESAPYAYVYGMNLPPVTKFLAYSFTFTTDAVSGSLSLSMKSDAILGAAKLTVFALGRDSSGLTLAVNQNSEFSDFTLIQSTLDATGPVAEGQSVTTTLHLKSNATKITEIITVDLNLQGSGKVAEQTGISIAPGASQDVTLSFKAPSSTGQYSISISSPQYSGPLASQTLQVTILQNNLQILIPAAIGIVAAIIILGIYMIKRQPESTEVEEKTKPAGSKPKTPGSGKPPAKSLT